MYSTNLPLGPVGYPDTPSLQTTIFRSPNNIPTLAEATQTRDLLYIMELELHQVHLDIAIILTRRADIMKRITNCKAILSPHKKLPAELISKILSFAITERHAIFPLREGRRDSRLRITQVCSRWRKIAFGTPDLWDLCFPPFCQSPSTDLGASWWSQYSGSKLRLSARYQPKLTPSSNSDFPLIDKLILPYSERLRDIRIAVSTRDLKKLLAATPGSFKSLEAITLWLHSRNFESWSEEGTMLMTAPKLRSVSISVLTQSWFFPNLPWGQLTQLTLNARIPADACFFILVKCTSLISCDLSYIDEDFGSVTEPGPLPEFPIYLPLLHSFTIQFQFGTFSSLLSHLSLPNLSEFLITTNITHRENHWTRQCKNFFQSMEGSLRHVEIMTSVEDPWQPNPLDEAIFWDFPNIQSFIAPQYHPLLSSTLEKIARGDLLRKIETLQFATENAADVVNILTRRGLDASPTLASGGISSIRSIQVSCQKTSAEVEEKLNEFRSNGVLVECVVPHNDPHTTSGDSDLDSS